MVDGFSSQSLEVAGNANGEDTILTTWLAKDGYPFDTNVEEIKFGNYTAHQVENNRLYLINEGWGADQTRELLNQLGTHQQKYKVWFCLAIPLTSPNFANQKMA